MENKYNPKVEVKRDEVVSGNEVNEKKNVVMKLNDYEILLEELMEEIDEVVADAEQTFGDVKYELNE